MFARTFTLLSCWLALWGAACTHSPTQDNTKKSTVTASSSLIQDLNQAPRGQKNVRQSLVRLRINNIDGADSFGTGFFFKNRHLLVTALHTFEKHPCLKVGSCEFTMGLVESSTSLSEIKVSAKIALLDPNSDLLFFAVKDEPILSKIIPLQKSNTSHPEQITAVGFYQDSPSLTFSHGIPRDRSENETTTTIVVSQGFSGAPVVNSQGELIGVVSSYHPLLANKEIGIARYVDVQ